MLWRTKDKERHLNARLSQIESFFCQGNRTKLCSFAFQLMRYCQSPVSISIGFDDGADNATLSYISKVAKVCSDGGKIDPCRRCTMIHDSILLLYPMYLKFTTEQIVWLIVIF